MRNTNMAQMRMKRTKRKDAARAEVASMLCRYALRATAR
jgi:hypothetical protein